MSVVLFWAGSALMQLYDFGDAYVRSGFNIKKTLLCLKYKRRLELFRIYCREYRNRPPPSLHTIRSPPEVKEFHVMDRIANEIEYAAVEADVLDGNCYSNDNHYGEAQMSSEYEVVTGEMCFGDMYVPDYFAHYDDINNMEEMLNLNVYENENETPVYYNRNVSNLVEGVSFTIAGTTKKYCERFSINFIIENATRDIALHINPRLPQNFIVRNTKVNNVWGKEEVSSALPFTLKRGSSFFIQVLFTKSCYMISVNGYHFCEFTHRIPFDNIRTIEIKGEIDNILVERKKVKEYPDHSIRPVPKPITQTVPPADYSSDDETNETADTLAIAHIPREWRRISLAERKTLQLYRDSNNELTLPFYGSIASDAFVLGSAVKIEGRIKMLPQAFYINLQTGSDVWPHPIIAMHLNIRFTKQQAGVIGRSTIIRNSWINGAWGLEERSDIDTEFRPGKTFSLCIVHGRRAFEIFVNHRLITQYKFRIPVNTIDTIYIQGDIKLWDVLLANEVSFTLLQPKSEWNKVSLLRRSMRMLLDPQKETPAPVKSTRTTQ